MESVSTSHHKLKVWSARVLDLILDPNPPLGVEKDIVKLSNDYAQVGNHSDLWNNAHSTQAYLHYFFPLNLLRMLPILKECQDAGFFNGLKRLVDFGSGPGTTDFALAEMGQFFSECLFIETSPKAIGTHQDMLTKFTNFPTIEFKQWHNSERRWIKGIPNDICERDLVVMTYSLNEIQAFPKEFLAAGAIIILEPSTRVSARNLQEQRSLFLDSGFYIWAPCTHHEDCPLLKHSKTDWCHNRIHIEKPHSIQQIEKGIPMKNDSLTYSYLCLSRKKPNRHTNASRIIGDTQYERGKVKQAICRNSSREFLTWLTRYGEPEPIPRGLCFEIPINHEMKGNEIRLNPKPL